MNLRVLAGPVRVPAQEACFVLLALASARRQRVQCFPARAGWPFVSNCEATVDQDFASSIASAIADPAASGAQGHPSWVLGPVNSVSSAYACPVIWTPFPPADGITVRSHPAAHLKKRHDRQLAKGQLSYERQTDSSDLVSLKGRRQPERPVKARRPRRRSRRPADDERVD